jgi:hypothetical protein
MKVERLVSTVTRACQTGAASITSEGALVSSFVVPTHLVLTIAVDPAIF